MSVMGTNQPGISRLVSRCINKGLLVRNDYGWRGVSLPHTGGAVFCDRCKALMGSAANDDVEVDAVEVSA